MDISRDKLQELSRRITVARMKLLCEHGFYGLLLMHVGFALTDEVEYASQDGKTICFNPEALDGVSDEALQYMLMHEIMHIALRHAKRGEELDKERFDIASDIVVNSNILKSSNMDVKSITVPELGGVMPHTAPDGREGYEFTAEELYELIMLSTGLPRKGPGKKMKEKAGAPGGDGDGGECEEDEENGSEKDEDDPDGKDSKDGKSKDKQKSKGKGSGAGEGDGDEGDGGGDDGTDDPDGNKKGGSQNGRAKKNAASKGRGGWDDHRYGEQSEDDEILHDVWVERIKNAAEAISIRDPSNSRGLIPAFAERMLKDLRKAQTDWRTILNDFVQEEINDYSFTPPDRRFTDSPFFLPDFNEKDETVKDILFMIDASGSMSDDMIAAAFSEIRGAIDQFNGHLAGWLGFFDAAVTEPIPFEDVDSLKAIRPQGGGGTDFQIIFEYVAEHMKDDPPASIIILTDGYAPIPAEHLAGGIPVLWLINNENVTPSWGKIARITV